MGDLTVIFLTVNKVPERWVEYHKQVLIEAIGDCSLITVSRKPMPDMPGINLIQTEPICAANVYWQILQASKVATTPFVAVAEDDTLYPPEHFQSFRPLPDHFAYNMNRWGIFTWDTPTFFWRRRFINQTFVGPRALTIEALEERFARHPNILPGLYWGELGRYFVERKMRVTSRIATAFETEIPVLYFCHVDGLDPYQQKRTKRMWATQCRELPYWGNAEEIVKRWN